jgi:hypothetical protein
MSERVLLWMGLMGVLVIYAQTIFFEFVFDDVVLILLNPWMHGWNHVRTIFGSTFWGFASSQAAGVSNFYRPFTMMWLFLVNQAGHGAPGFFHLGVVLMHLVVMLEVYLLGRKLTGSAVTGALAALLFGIHPTHIESVAWISGISDVLCAAFFVGALLTYLRWADEGGMRWLLCSLLLLESALLSKETAALLLVVILLDRFRHFRGMDLLSRTVHSVYVSLPYIMVSALHFTWQSHVISRHNSRFEPPALNPSAALTPYAIWWYVKKQFLTLHVSAYYATPAPGDLTTLQIVAASVFCLALLALACWLFVRSRAGMLMVTLFAITLLPVVLGAQMLQLHDRYLYLPGIAISIGVAALVRQLPLLRDHAGRQFVIVLAIVAWLVPLACKEASYWTSDIALFQHSIEVEPHTILNLEVLFEGYVMNGDDAHAEQVLRRSVAEFPERPRTWTQLAVFLLKRGKLDEADACARHAITVRPINKSLPAAFDVIAEVALKRGRVSEAELWAKRSVTADNSSTSHRTLAAVYAAEGELAKSTAESKTAMALDAVTRSQ